MIWCSVEVGRQMQRLDEQLRRARRPRRSRPIRELERSEEHKAANKAILLLTAPDRPRPRTGETEQMERK